MNVNSEYFVCCKGSLKSSFGCGPRFFPCQHLFTSGHQCLLTGERMLKLHVSTSQSFSQGMLFARPQVFGYHACLINCNVQFSNFVRHLASNANSRIRSSANSMSSWRGIFAQNTASNSEFSAPKNSSDIIPSVFSSAMQDPK